jgi:hypothetical protein
MTSMPSTLAFSTWRMKSRSSSPPVTLTVNSRTIALRIPPAWA